VIGLAEKTETVDEFAQRMTELGHRGLLKGLLRSATRLSLKAERYAKLNTSTLLSVRTGRLRSSLAGSADLTGGTLNVKLRAGGPSRGGTVKYAGIQEFGGTVRAKPGKMLRIPLPPALTGAGVDRYPPPLRTTGKGLFTLIMSKSGDKEGMVLIKNSTGEPWYVLKSSVKIKGKHYMGKAMDKVRSDAPGVFLPVMRSLVLDSSRVPIAGGD